MTHLWKCPNAAITDNIVRAPTLEIDCPKCIQCFEQLVTMRLAKEGLLRVKALVTAIERVLAL